VAEGVRRKRFFDPERPQYKGLQTLLADAAQHWIGANDVLHSYRNELPIHILSYEALVLDTERTLRKVFEFCRLPFQGHVPEYRPDENIRSENRLSLAELEEIDSVVRPFATELGYARRNP